jgi:hypothetical protein
MNRNPDFEENEKWGGFGEFDVNDDDGDDDDGEIV